MHFLTTVSSLAVLATAALALAPLHVIEKFNGETTGRHIITLKEGAYKDSIFRKVKVSTTSLTHEWDLIRGFAGHFNDETLNLLRSSPEVESVSEDGIMHVFATQTNAPWGLGRISSSTKLTVQDAAALEYQYTYPDSAGTGVDIYVVDSGIRTTHTTFGGRARWGATFGGYPDVDDNGHGTHCAGTAAGSQWGVAKNASLIAVKVLSDKGSGSVANFVSGLAYVGTQAMLSGRPSIVSMSLGGNSSTPLDLAVAALTNTGVHVVVAAGNSNTDAGGTSPARAPSAVTVGATTIDDARAPFSNFGSALDIWAPGRNITSAWATNDTATNRISGTSMATPHVAGAIAVYISRDGNLSPAEMSSKLQSTALKNVISGIPAGTVNNLLHIA